MVELTGFVDEPDARAVLSMWRAQRALVGAPDLVSYVRQLSIGGQTERGETLPEWTAPMRITAADDSDATYAQLVDWVMYWSEKLRIDAPSATVIASRDFHGSHASLGYRDAPINGFRAGTTVSGAHILVSIQTMWLGLRREQIVEDPQAIPYFEDIGNLIGRLSARYPTAPRPPRSVSPRPCPSCGEAAIGAQWLSESMRDVVVSCSYCGHTIDASTYSRVLEWLT